MSSDNDIRFDHLLVMLLVSLVQLKVFPTISTQALNDIGSSYLCDYLKIINVNEHRYVVQWLSKH
jgi:hypothetical protein